MIARNTFKQLLAITGLLSIGLLSCQKQTSPLPGDAGNPDTKTVTSLTVGGPPTVIWWANGIAIPYKNASGELATVSSRAEGFTINGKGYVCGGAQYYPGMGGDFSEDLWEYDPSTTMWTKKASSPGINPTDAVAFVIGDNAYLVAGNACWQYNQPADLWTRKASLPAPARNGGSGFAINGKGYVGLGYNNTNTAQFDDWWEYDPATDHWTSRKTFPGTKVGEASSFAIGGKGYIVGGGHLSSEGNMSNPKGVWQYDPVADNWQKKADFPAPGRNESVGANATVGGTDVGFVIGGFESSAIMRDDAWEYFPTTDSWVQLPSVLGGERTDPAAFVIGRSLYIANISVVVLNWSN
jgi:N-acetylneuraminic acid mutarotase